MPVLRHVPSDPTDLVIQGESFRNFALASPVAMPLRTTQEPPASNVIAGEQNLRALVGSYPVCVSERVFEVVANNAGIVTTCGEWVPTLGVLVAMSGAGGSTVYVDPDSYLLSAWARLARDATFLTRKRFKRLGSKLI